MCLWALAPLMALSALSPAAAPSRNPESLTATLPSEIRRIAAPIGGEVGVAAWRLDGSGEHVLVNGTSPFRWRALSRSRVASALAKVDVGELTLDRMLLVDSTSYVESEIIAETLPHPGLSLSIYNLLDQMLTRSDNTTTDVLTAVAGGPAAVTAWVRKQGVAGLRVDRDTAGILREFFGLPQGTSVEPSLPRVRQIPNSTPGGTSQAPLFDSDPRDTLPPVAMAALTRIFTESLVTRKHDGPHRHAGVLSHQR